MGTEPVAPAVRIRQRAVAEGFDVVGISPAQVPAGVGDALEAWLAAGCHGEMAWMATHAARRRDPRTLWPEAQSVVVVGQNYAPREDPRRGLAYPDRGLISVYARNRDYHDRLKGRLKALAGWMHREFAAGVKVFVDTAPVPEKPLAQQAGVGWAGRHTNIVSRRFGSWLFLGVIYTDLALAPDPPAVDLCGRCTRCLDACPTAALTAPGRLDARRCLSYLTIEHAGPIPEGLRSRLGNRIYGCDDCMAACPWNRFAPPTRDPAFLPRIELTAPRLAELAVLDDASFRQLFAGSPIKRIGRDRFVRNVLVAIGNSGLPALRPVAESRCDDPAPLVQEAARWAVAQLCPTTEEEPPGCGDRR